MTHTEYNALRRRITQYASFSLTAAHGWVWEHMDIVNAYVHDPPMHTRQIYVNQMSHGTGRYQKDNMKVRLQHNHLGGTSAW